jgi:cyclopropane fatty-acyl-phospholipid synthase-like methyltransferase
MTLKINKNGSWDIRTNDYHRNDASLNLALVKFLKGNSVIDIGCGDGTLVRSMLDNDIDAVGYDGNPHIKELTLDICNYFDFSIDASELEKRDWAISLEVGEHIPNEFEDIFIANLHKLNTKGIIISWAIPGQLGDGHVNTQSNEYIKDIFLKLGYTNRVDIETSLREASELWWYKNTIMVFEK